MKNPFIQLIGNLTRFPYSIPPFENYEQPIDFPLCCPFHKNVFEGSTAWFNEFPNCCSQHKEMANSGTFNKSNYAGTVEKILNQLSYTESQICQRIDREDWYEDITEYIEYNIDSLGNPAIGLHRYLKAVKEYLQVKNEIPSDKSKLLISFIDNYGKDKKDRSIDIDKLFSIYKKWHSIFPFELSFFHHLKDRYNNQFLFLLGKPQVNRYITWCGKVQGHTPKSLINALIQLTKIILTDINTSVLDKKGLLTEPDLIYLELIRKGRKFQLENGYKINPLEKDQKIYIKLINKWFKEEKKFIEEIRPVLERLDSSKGESKFDKIRQALSVNGFFELTMVKNLSIDNKENLVKLIASNKMPYGIAMFDYLGFCTYLDDEKGSKYKADFILSRLFNENSKDGTPAKHLRRSLVKTMVRYKAGEYKEIVKIDYQKLK